MDAIATGALQTQVAVKLMADLTQQKQQEGRPSLELESDTDHHVLLSLVTTHWNQPKFKLNHPPESHYPQLSPNTKVSSK